MTLVQFLLIISTVFALSVGQILFKLAAANFELSMPGLIHSAQNPTLIVGFIVYFAATLMWLVVLRMTPLRVAYPFIALAFVIVPVLAYFFLGDKIHWNTFAGAALIGLGVWISVFH